MIENGWYKKNNFVLGQMITLSLKRVITHISSERLTIFLNQTIQLDYGKLIQP